MAFIEVIGPDRADGKLAELYRRVSGPGGQVDNVLQVHSLRRLLADETVDFASYFAYANRTVSGLGVRTAGERLGLSPEAAENAGEWSHG